MMFHYREYHILVTNIIILKFYFSEALCNVENPTKDHQEWLKKALKDPSIWDEGLDPIYKKFLSSLPTTNPIVACLLSIL